MPGTVTVAVLDLSPIFGIMNPIDTIPVVVKQSMDPRQIPDNNATRFAFLNAHEVSIFFFGLSGFWPEAQNKESQN